ncbi:MAG: hypothetical protein R2851_14160 [Caldilineaceae bacterium]
MVENGAHLIAVILTKNEAHNVGAHRRPARLDRRRGRDSGSTDATVAVAQAAGAQVVMRPFDNYAAQRQAAGHAQRDVASLCGCGRARPRPAWARDPPAHRHG